MSICSLGRVSTSLLLLSPSVLIESPDIRTLYLLFVLSFVDTTSAYSVKVAFLEQHRDAFTSIFKGLWQDPYSVIRRVLEVCWSGLWSDPKLKRTLKIQVFNETTLSQVRADAVRGFR